MIDFIFTAITIWILMAFALWMMFALDTYVISPVCDFVANSPFIKYIVLPFLVIMAILSTVLMYYRKYPEKTLLRWLQKDCDKNPELRKFLNR